MNLRNYSAAVLLLMCAAPVIYAKSPCYKLATTAFFARGLSPAISTPESLTEANLEMADAETFCKRLVQAVKIKKITSEKLRGDAEQFLKDAKLRFEQDGDMDKLELAKYQHALVMGSARIAEESP